MKWQWIAFSPKGHYAFLVIFLAFDIVFLPNCVPPLLDTNPKTLEKGQNEFSATYDGSAFLLFPQGISFDERIGWRQGLEVGGRFEFFHGKFRIQETNSFETYESTQSDVFMGGSAQLKKQLGSPLLALQTALGFYYGIDLREKPMGLWRTSLLLGKPWLHAAVGMHISHVDLWAFSPAISLASTLGKVNHFKLSFHFEENPNTGFMPSFGIGLGHTW